MRNLTERVQVMVDPKTKAWLEGRAAADGVRLSTAVRTVLAECRKADEEAAE